MVLLCASLLVAGCGGAAQSNVTPTMVAVPVSATPATSTTGTEAALAAFDQMFIDMMVPHHQSATAMAQIALERAGHPEIRTMAEEMITKQEAEIAELQIWRSAWYGIAETPPMSAMPTLPGMASMSGMDHEGGGMQVMDMAQAVEALRSAPEPFDLAFIDAMIPHHAMAIEAAQMALEQAVHPELATMAEQIIEDQQKEITELQTWRAAWYPDAAAP